MSKYSNFQLSIARNLTHINMKFESLGQETLTKIRASF